MDWASIILSIVAAISSTGFIITLFTLRSIKRQKDAEAGMTEEQLRKSKLETEKLNKVTELEIDQLQDEAVRQKFKQISSELQIVRDELNKSNLLIVELNKRNLELNKTVFDKEIEILELTRQAAIAEGLKKNRCDHLLCSMRIPPLDNSELGEHNLIDPKLL